MASDEPQDGDTRSGPLSAWIQSHATAASGPPASGELRLAPGTMLAGRYRIVAPLGRGGMGEIYRAEDVKLGQAVALKFLRSSLAHDPALLERLLAEVRIGREVSHPNVCRLYDVVEFDGRHFITMEYVDGEDLGSLLSRIGRLPERKALDLPRERSCRTQPRTIPPTPRTVTGPELNKNQPHRHPHPKARPPPRRRTPQLPTPPPSRLLTGTQRRLMPPT
jgi:hypothetical protein